MPKSGRNSLRDGIRTRRRNSIKGVRSTGLRAPLRQQLARPLRLRGVARSRRRRIELKPSLGHAAGFDLARDQRRGAELKPIAHGWMLGELAGEDLDHRAGPPILRSDEIVQPDEGIERQIAFEDDVAEELRLGVA